MKNIFKALLKMMTLKNIKTEYWKLNNINKFYFDKTLKFEAWFYIE